MNSPVRAQLFGVPSLEHDGQSWALPFERRTQLLALLGEFNTAGTASLVVPSEYLEVVITKR